MSEAKTVFFSKKTFDYKMALNIIVWRENCLNLSMAVDMQFKIIDDNLLINFINFYACGLKEAVGCLCSSHFT